MRGKHIEACMQVTFNPKDSNTFASASLDRTVKVWSIGQPTPNFTLEGHEKGVNAVDYFTGGESPRPRCSVEPSCLKANLHGSHCSASGSDICSHHTQMPVLAFTGSAPWQWPACQPLRAIPGKPCVSCQR